MCVILFVIMCVGIWLSMYVSVSVSVIEYVSLCVLQCVCHYVYVCIIVCKCFCHFGCVSLCVYKRVCHRCVCAIVYVRYYWKVFRDVLSIQICTESIKKIKAYWLCFWMHFCNFKGDSTYYRTKKWFLDFR